MRLVWSRRADADRVAIFNYVEAENPRAAADLDKRLVAAAERLTSYPDLGRTGRVPGTREFVAHPRYILVYTLDPEAVHIVTILHTSRQWPPSE